MGKTIQVHGFPSGVGAEEVKAFMESRTGVESVTAIKVRKPKNGGPRDYAIVQFTLDKHAAHFISLAANRLYYGTSYLKAREMERDIVPKPRTFAHTISNVNLYLGCQISKERFSVLWKAPDASLNLSYGMRKLQFLLSYYPRKYKLELSYENIGQVELHHPTGQNAKYLLIQMYGAPRLFVEDITHCFPYEDFFRGGSDDQWVRSTDFTPSLSIGQSSGLCLELPYDLTLPNFKENFAFYKEIQGTFVLERGSSYSSNMELIPMVAPPQDINLPFEILFRINSLVQNGYLAGPTLDSTFYRLLDPRRFNLHMIEHALEKLFHLRECCYQPSQWLKEQYRTCLSSRTPIYPAISLDNGLVYVRRLQITPVKVYFAGPEINISNRVLRNYPEDINNFLRVSFVDEEFEKMRSTDLCPRSSPHKKTGIYKRILSTLQNGIVIGDKKFDFLAFSSSQLRENSAWMFASRRDLTAADIRNWMGDFCQIRNVAKYAARLGQSFSSSTETLTVRREEIEVIPDVEVISEGFKYVFSDGIGKISAEFARRVAKKCSIRDCIPSAFQIRYGGYKGVVAVDPCSQNKLSLRKSMCKYESLNTKLDVLVWSKYQPCFLNRQLISLLSTLGIQDHVFEKKQREAVEGLDAILTDPLRAQEALELMSPGESTNVLKEMLMCGYKPDAEPFLSMMLQTFRASKLLELRTKTRIFIPNGRSMMGCLDETRTLNYGEVFVQFSDTPALLGGSRSNLNYIVERKVVVAKNPCLHPGDVRVLKAVNVPALHHLVDCVVFPQKGKRPHPNECSGSDLDGDIYFVCWDPELVPRNVQSPMDYTPPPTIELDHDVMIEEVEEYFTNYIENDSLGIIANAHTVFADKEPMKALSTPCVELARLFSIAVDFPKTGVPAVIPQHLHVREYPDFMEKLDKPTYVSRNVIGKLFREVKEKAPHTSCVTSFTREVALRSYDADMEVIGFMDYVDDAIYYKSNYDYRLGNLMDYYGIKTEAEIVGGSIMRMSKSFTKRRDDESISIALRSLRKEARSWFNEKSTGSDSGTDDDFAKASAWYHVTYHPTYWGLHNNEGVEHDHFLSFPWCVYDKLIQIKKDNARIQRALELDFSGLRLS